MPLKKQRKNSGRGRTKKTLAPTRSASSLSPKQTDDNGNNQHSDNDDQNRPRSDSNASSVASVNETVVSVAPSDSNSSQTQNDRQKRARKTPYSLTDEEEKSMLEFLQDNPMLWDIKMTDFRRTDKKNKLWEDQAALLGKTADYLRGWFKSLRDNFTRLDKKKSGDGAPDLTEREQWVKENFSFLKVATRHRPEPVNSVIESYKELLWLIDLQHFPADYEPPSNYSMLLYELHFHLGVAYQHTGNHIKATELFSRTIQDVSIAKNGCLAGCLTNSCLMTPVYTRRAFAHAFLGQYKHSIKDAEKAVVLDSGNPYVYCIRALVRSTFDDEIQGLRDLEEALKIDKEHVCATMLKASFTKPLVTDDTQQYGFYGKFLDLSDEESDYIKLKQKNGSQSPRLSASVDLKVTKAVRLCQEAETYLTCNNFQHPCILEFYDKFLFPLSVPHTITKIDLTPDKPSKKQLEAQASQSVKERLRPLSAPVTPTNKSRINNNNNVFRCGTPQEADTNRMSLKRRMDYGNAIRQHVSRPQSAQEFFKQLEVQRKRETDIRRAQSAIVRPGQKFARSQTAQSELKQNTYPVSRPITAATSFPETTHKTKTGGNSVAVFETSSTVASQVPKSTSELVQRLIKKKEIQIEAPNTCAIPVFQPINIKFAPRMYYRPWQGDKLPTTERKSIKYSPKFY